MILLCCLIFWRYSFIISFKIFNNEILEINKKLSEIRKVMLRTSRSSQAYHRSELNNINEKLIQANDKEKTNMDILSSKPFFKDLKDLKQDMTLSMNPKKYETVFKKRHKMNTSRRSIQSELSKGLMPSLNSNTPVNPLSGFNFNVDLFRPPINKLAMVKTNSKQSTNNISKLSLQEPITSRAHYKRKIRQKNMDLARDKEIRLILKKVSKVVIRQSMLTSTRADEVGSNF